MLVVGTSNQAFELAETLRNDPLRSDPLHRCRFLGYVAAGEPASARVAASEIVADPQTAIELLNDQVVDELVVALTLRDITPEVEALMRHAAQLGITVRCPVNQLFSGVYGDEVTRLSSEASRSGTARWAKDLVMRSGYGYSWQYVAKRIFDVVGALALLVITSPLMIAAAIAITTTSRGGVFFIQDRYGYNGRVIRLLKFRTMGQDADAQQARLRAEHNEMDGGAFKMKNDPRVTRVGAFLRKTSIDELPQLFNVLRGEMSLVGPRPLPLADYDHIEQISHLRRLSVLPGITCTWQAGGRNNVSFEQWMALDMAYIDNWSLLEDFRILLKTVPAVLLARGAA